MKGNLEMTKTYMKPSIRHLIIDSLNTILAESENTSKEELDVYDEPMIENKSEIRSKSMSVWEFSE